MTIAEELKKFPLFKSVELNELEALASMMQQQSYPQGAVLFEKDQPGDAMYLIRTGRIRVFLRDPQGNEITFRHFGPGQVVGEFALIDDKPRSASAEAAEPLEVMTLSREHFLALLRERPILGVEMMRNLAERVRYTTNYLEKLFSAINLLVNSEYEQAIKEMSITTDEDEIQNLINAFVQMVTKLREREAALNQAALRSEDKGI
ncbi:MAG TPA: cyclic nucleotide-binding domain-containing protein [Oceanobacillus sp.]|nr:cyclic nucleotide-binding domain-containing protein [Oceanobacillus sp.]